MFRGNILEWTENRLGARNCHHRSAVWPSPFNLCTAVSSPGKEEDGKDHLHHPPACPSLPSVRSEGRRSPFSSRGPMAGEGRSPPRGGEPRDTSVTLPGAPAVWCKPLASCSPGDALRTGVEDFVLVTQAGSLADQSSRQSTLTQCQDRPVPLLGLIQCSWHQSSGSLSIILVLIEAPLMKATVLPVPLCRGSAATTYLTTMISEPFYKLWSRFK